MSLAIKGACVLEETGHLARVILKLALDVLERECCWQAIFSAGTERSTKSSSLFILVRSHADGAAVVARAMSTR